MVSSHSFTCSCLSVYCPARLPSRRSIMWLLTSQSARSTVICPCACQRANLLPGPSSAFWTALLSTHPSDITPTHLHHVNPSARLSTVPTVILYAAPPIHLPVRIFADRFAHPPDISAGVSSICFQLLCQHASRPSAHLEMITSDIQ